VNTLDYLRQGQLIFNEFFKANNPITFQQNLIQGKDGSYIEKTTKKKYLG
jgi:hypothetical protein